MRAISKRSCLLLALAVCWAAPSEARAVSLELAIDEIAEGVQGYLKDKGDGVVIGRIDGPAGTNASGVMKKFLTDKLKARNIKIKRLTGMKLGINYSQLVDGTTLFVKIKAELKDTNGQQVRLSQLAQEQIVDDRTDIASILGATFDATTPDEADVDEETEVADQEKVSTKKLDVELTKSATKPNIEIAPPKDRTASAKQSVIFPKKGSPYRIEIVKQAKDGSYSIPCTVVKEDGLAFVDLEVGDVYGITVYNHSKYDAGVMLSIDGLNTFEFCEYPPWNELGLWLIRAGEAATIKGWLRDEVGYSWRFLVSHFPDSEAAKLNKGGLKVVDEAGIGTITATFFAAWPEGFPVPPIEPAGQRGKGTKKGALFREDLEAVPRIFGRTPLASVSVRYSKPAPDDLPDDVLAIME